MNLWNESRWLVKKVDDLRWAVWAPRQLFPNAYFTSWGRAYHYAHRQARSRR